jgi:hypothetical protein
MSADFENATTKLFQEMAADAVAFIVVFAPGAPGECIRVQLRSLQDCVTDIF